MESVGWNMLNQLRIVKVFIRRDWIIYRSMAYNLLINNSIISPLIYTYAYGYVIPRLGLSNVTNESATVFFAGSILTMMFPLAFTWHQALLQDFEHTRFITYQTSVLAPAWVMFERILFGSWIVMLHGTLLFPVSALLLGKRLVLYNASIWKIALCLYAGAVLCSTFVVFVICYVQDFRSIRNFWLRVNHPMLQLGGLFIPWYVMNELSPLIGLITLCNPMLYITEGLKHSITGDPRFFSFTYSIAGIAIFSVIFYRLTLYYLRKKIDHI